MEKCKGKIFDELKKMIGSKQVHFNCPSSINPNSIKDDKELILKIPSQLKVTVSSIDVDGKDEITSMNKKAENDIILKNYAEVCRSLSKPFVPHTHIFKLTNELRWHIVEKSKPVLEQKCVCTECGEEYWEPVITFVEL